MGLSRLAWPVLLSQQSQHPGQQSLVVLPSQKQGRKTRGQERVSGRGGRHRGGAMRALSPAAGRGLRIACLLTVHTLMTLAPRSRGRQTPSPPRSQSPIDPFLPLPAVCTRLTSGFFLASDSLSCLWPDNGLGFGWALLFAYSKPEFLTCHVQAPAGLQGRLRPQSPRCPHRLPVRNP